MAGVIGALSSLPMRRRPSFIQTSYATATAYPCGISRDRATLFGSKFTADLNLYQSVDDGTTWTVAKAFPEPPQGAWETSDGEILVMTFDNTVGRIYKSSGWTASHTAFTFTKVLTAVKNFRNMWALHAWTFGDDKILAGSGAIGITTEYGSFTDGTNDSADSSVKAYLTTNFGATWTTVLDLAVRFPGVAGMSTMFACYDPYWDRLWVVHEGGNDSTKLPVLYSDDHGQSWTALPQPTVAISAGMRFVDIVPMEDCLVLHGAHNDGIYRIARTGYRKAGPLQAANITWPHNSNGMIGMGAYRAPVAGAPLILGSVAAASGEDAYPYLQATTDGLEFAEFWRDTNLRNVTAAGPLDVYGPTAGGKIVARVDQTGAMTSWKLLVGELQVEPPLQRGGTSTQDGTGAKTVFTIPHGFASTPGRVTVAPGSAAAAVPFFVTVDATNVTVTFTTAPASGTANVALVWTAAL